MDSVLVWVDEPSGAVVVVVVVTVQDAPSHLAFVSLVLCVGPVGVVLPPESVDEPELDDDSDDEPSFDEHGTQIFTPFTVPGH